MKSTDSSTEHRRSTARIDHLYVDPHSPEARLFLHYGDLSDGTRLVTLLAETSPDGVYNLAAQSHVRVSFDEPEHTPDTTTPRREFMHSDDMADACLHLLEHYDGPDQVNVGTGTDTTIREIAEKIASLVSYTGETLWDTTKPDGTPQKLLDVSKLAGTGWSSTISLRDGLEDTIDWYRANAGDLRG